MIFCFLCRCRYHIWDMVHNLKHVIKWDGNNRQWVEQNGDPAPDHAPPPDCDHHGHAPALGPQPHHHGARRPGVPQPRQVQLLRRQPDQLQVARLREPLRRHPSEFVDKCGQWSEFPTFITLKCSLLSSWLLMTQFKFKERTHDTAVIFDLSIDALWFYNMFHVSHPELTKLEVN